MKRWILMLVGVAAIALVAAGCSGSSSGGGMPGMDMGEDSTTTEMSTESTAIAPTDDFNEADVVFAQGMIPHHKQALEMAALAEKSASSQEVKDLAAQISAAQDPEIEQMTGWLQDWGQPTEMAGMGSMEMDGMMSDSQMADLEAASGEDFDTMFLEMMIEHDQGAIKMAETEISDGKNPDAIALAESIVEAQQAEIDTMQSILDGQ